MSNTHVKNIKLGACKVSFGGVDLGYTKGGVQVEVATETLKVTVDQHGQTTMSELVQGRNITITAPLAESVLRNMVDLMPGSTMSEEDNSVTITSAQGVNLIDVAKELILTPQDTTDYVLTIPKAATAGNFTMTYQSDDVRVFSVQFTAYPDDDGVLGKMSGPKQVKAVSLSPERPTVKVGETVQLTAEITPADAGDKSGVWASENEDKATVDQGGLVRRVAEGSANISFTSNSGNKKATKAVTVNAAS
ncbi:Ig domain-containing protein [Salmonella enterica subsp. enterica serovar Saintpaul]|uniref:Ig-like domain-containing protein n=1 Tax=Salmonella enterica TaxID=28901 RepID=UPI00145A170D|nr:Ig domain-containing protein [Salmonella enterica]NMI67250.1 Ig domain-containing protein [Salmonella enterica subsp. enterica serovar Bovismorbificans]NMJ39501.1 Ig domain-containing protein [Salmonella enterica subsp. enterica serovar Saintpaul]NMJ51868.1 Ig domain-containing protein [Salmonella enterica subsp. enterica serovar Anatum]